MTFLRDRELRPLNLPEAPDLKPVGLALGKGGGNPLEVVIAEATGKPNLSALRAVWRKRLAGRATPLLFVVIYDGKAALCGPGPQEPPAFLGLDPSTVERICATALDEPNRHAALRFLRSVIPQLEPEVRVAGLYNAGLLATHEIQRDVPRREDWQKPVEKAKGALRLRGESLVKALGFSFEALPGSAYILRAVDTKLAVALFLNRDESPDSPNPRFGNRCGYGFPSIQNCSSPWNQSASTGNRSPKTLCS